MIEGENIAMIGAYPPIHSGGIATHVHGISKELSKHNTITVITTGTKKGYWDDYVVKVYQEKLWYPQRYTTFQSMVQTTKRALSLRKKVDLYHAHGTFFSGIGFLDKQKPLVLTVHGYSSLETVSRGRIKPNSIQFEFMRWVEKKAVKRADAVIVVDSTIKNFVINTLNAEKEKVFCIPNGVDVDEFFPIVNLDNRRKKYIKDDEKLIVCIRRFVPKNGVFIVLEAMNLLVNEKKEKKAKLILGGGGPLENDFKKYIKEKKLQDYITILGSIPHKEMPEYFAAADIIVNTFTHIPYVKEQEVSSMLEALDNGHPIGTSITTVEALAAGKCTIVCTVGGKYIKNHPSDPGILLSDKNPNLLAEILYKLIGDDELRTKIGRNGREYVVLKRSWKAVVKEVEKVYSFVLGGSS